AVAADAAAGRRERPPPPRQAGGRGGGVAQAAAAQCGPPPPPRVQAASGAGGPRRRGRGRRSGGAAAAERFGSRRRRAAAGRRGGVRGRRVVAGGAVGRRGRPREQGVDVDGHEGLLGGTDEQGLHRPLRRDGGRLRAPLARGARAPGGVRDAGPLVALLRPWPQRWQPPGRGRGRGREPPRRARLRAAEPAGLRGPVPAGLGAPVRGAVAVWQRALVALPQPAAPAGGVPLLQAPLRLLRRRRRGGQGTAHRGPRGAVREGGDALSAASLPARHPALAAACPPLTPRARPRSRWLPPPLGRAAALLGPLATRPLRGGGRAGARPRGPRKEPRAFPVRRPFLLVGSGRFAPR
ncbi:unnamed protein product, partial [Prorocentrum cordatum]